MAANRIRNALLYGGVTKDEFETIRPYIWSRNRNILSITSLLAAGMGSIFLIYVLLAGTGLWFPYVFLLTGSLLIFALNRLTYRSENEGFRMVLCYAQMLLVCAYAGILSVQPSNYGVPATSIVVFIALLPLTIDDRFIRMTVFVLAESGAYLVVSRFFKSPEAFGLDVLNVITFAAVGMILYAVICTRNIREIHQGVRISRIQRSVITSMATVVEERDENTGGHIHRTENHVRAMIERMRRDPAYAHLTETYCSNVILAAPMHDIGKIRIPDAILNKPGKLTPDEYEIMKNHSEYGAEIIRKTMEDIEEEDYFEVACNIAKYHHERYDGSGYPCGLKGEEIPLEARVMALADTYDALISDRVYKKAFSPEVSRRIIEENRGTQFDPKLTDIFLSIL